MSDFEQRERATRQAMEKLRRQWQEKNNERIAAQTGIESAEREMQEILEEVRASMNVESIDELRRQYLEGLERNEALVQELEAALARCEEMQRELEKTLD